MDLPDHPLLVADLGGCKRGRGRAAVLGRDRQGGAGVRREGPRRGEARRVLREGDRKAKVADKLPGRRSSRRAHRDRRPGRAARVASAGRCSTRTTRSGSSRAKSIHYTANRMMDIAAGLDAASNAVANCAGGGRAAGKRDDLARRQGGRALGHEGVRRLRREGARVGQAAREGVGVLDRRSRSRRPASSSRRTVAIRTCRTSRRCRTRCRPPCARASSTSPTASNAHPKAGLTAVTVSLDGEKLTTKKVTATDAAIDSVREEQARRREDPERRRRATSSSSRSS